MADEIRALALTGMLGSGFHESSFERALSWEPDFIGCDAGSTDSGPGSLGTGVPAQPRQGIKRDLRIGLLAALQRRIPLLVGSAGSGGGDANLAAVVEVTQEIARGHHPAAGGAGRPEGGRPARRPAVLRPGRAGYSLT